MKKSFKICQLKPADVAGKSGIVAISHFYQR